MAEFNINRNNDAYATIRGFVYQTQLSILKWLELEDNQTLILEKGEDIDIITNALKQDNFDGERLLIQVKNYQSSNISLNSDSAKKGLFDFYQHQINNPTLNLKYQFFTTQEIGKDEKLNLNDILRGIEIWERIRKRKKGNNQGITNKKLEDLLDGLKDFLSKQSVPKGIKSKSDNNDDDVDNEKWETWTKYIGKLGRDKLNDFIQSFEWNTGNDNVDDLKDKVISKLLGLGVDRNILESVYNYLFEYVFQKLCKSGEKKLDKISLNQILTQQVNLTLPVNNIMDKLDELDKKFNESLAITKEIREIVKDLSNTHNQVWLQKFEEDIRTFKPKAALENLQYFKDNIKELSDKEQSQLNYLLGLCYEELGHFSKANDYYLQAFSYDEENIIYQIKMMLSFIHMSENEEAKNLCDKILSNDRLNPLALAVKVFLIEKKTLEEATSELIKPYLLKNENFHQTFSATLVNLVLKKTKGVYTSILFLFDNFNHDLSAISLTFDNKLYWLVSIHIKLLDKINKIPIHTHIKPQSFINDIKFQKLVSLQESLISKLDETIYKDIYVNTYFFHYYGQYLITFDKQFIEKMISTYKKFNEDKGQLLLQKIIFSLSQTEQYEKVILTLKDDLLEKSDNNVLWLLKAIAFDNLKRYEEARPYFIKHFKGLKHIDKNNIYLVFRFLNYNKDITENTDIVQRLNSNNAFKDEFVKILIETTVARRGENVDEGQVLSNLDKLKSIIKDNDCQDYLELLAIEYYELKKYSEVIELLQEVVLKNNATDIQFKVFINSLWNTRQDDKLFLECLTKWRANSKYQIVYEFLIWEIELLFHIRDWKTILEIAKIGISNFPSNDVFKYYTILAVSNLNKKEDLHNLLNNKEYVNLGLPQEAIFHIVNIAIQQKNFQLAMDLIYPYAKEIDNKEARFLYFTLFGLDEANQLFKKYDKVVDNSYVQIDEKGVRKIIHIDFNKTIYPYVNELKGKEINHTIEYQSKTFKNKKRKITIIKIMDKYEKLIIEISEEVQSEKNPFFESLQLPNGADEMREFLVEQFGSEGTFNKAIFEDYEKRYLDGFLSFVSFAQFWSSPLNAYRYLTLTPNMGFKVIPLVSKFKFSLNDDTRFVLDYTSLPLMVNLTEKYPKIDFGNKFIVSQFLVEQIQGELYKIQSSTQSYFSMNITLEGIKPVFKSESYYEQEIQYFKNTLSWINKYCVIGKAYDKLNMITQLKEHSKIYEKGESEKDERFDLMLDITYLSNQDNTYLISDDIITADLLLKTDNFVSSEVYLRWRFNLDYSDRILPFLVENQYYGMLLNYQLLEVELIKHLANEPNNYLTCLKSISIYNIHNVDYAVELAVRLIKKIQLMQGITLQTKRFSIQEIFKYLLLFGERTEQLFRRIEAQINYEFRIIPNYIDEIIDDFKIIWRHY